MDEDLSAGPPLRPRALHKLSLAQLTSRLRALPTVDEAVLRALARDRRAGVRALAMRIRRRMSRVERESLRLNGLRTVEAEQMAEGYLTISGVDEAGVAPLAGPVVAAAVILPPDFQLPRLNDSKQLNAAQRELLYAEIQSMALAVHVAMGEVEEIDRLNILQATRLAHRRAILGLPARPDLVLIDGRFAADVPVPQLVMVDADATCASVAAASFVAKVTRDRLMRELAARFPQYGFDVHKGYGTRKHYQAIERFGLTPVHRRSFLPARGKQQALPIG